MTTQRNGLPNGDYHNYATGGGRRDHYTGPLPFSSSSAATLKGCCCCLFLLLVFIALVALAVVLVIVLALKPKKPQFELQQVSVQYLLVTSTANSDPSAVAASGGSPPAAAYLSLNITLLFSADNPNRVEIEYRASEFDVMHRGVPLGKATVPGFSQPAHSRRLVESLVTVDRFNVLQADALDLVHDAAVNDRVEFRVTGDLAAKIRVIGLTSPRVQVTVDCVIVISPRKQSLTYKQCGVDGVNF